MTKISETEYEELKWFARYFFDRFFSMQGMSPDAHPLVQLEVTEKTAPGRAAQGLRMMVNDFMEMSSDWSDAKVEALDKELTERGLLSLSCVRQKYSRTYASILKRGHLRSDVEYYLVRGILSDQSLSLQGDERSKLETMVVSYEQTKI